MWLRFLSAALSLSVLLAALQFPVAAAAEPSITSGILSSLATAFGVSDLDGVYCVNCSEKVNLDGLESGLLSAVCPSCEKSVFLNSDGKVSFGGFSGFGGGSSRGGGAGRDPEPVISSSGDFRVPCYFKSIRPESYITNAGSSLFLNYQTAGTCQLWWGYYKLSNYYYRYSLYFTPPVTGIYTLEYRGMISCPSASFSYKAVSSSGVLESYLCDAVLDLSWERSDIEARRGVPLSLNLGGYNSTSEPGTSLISTFMCPYNSITESYFPVSGYLTVTAVLESFDHPDLVSPSIDKDLSSVIIGSVAIPYDVIYKYGDTYISYYNNNSTIYYTDQSGAIIGSCVYDNSTNTFQITDFSSNPPMPSPVPSAAPQPSAPPGGSGGSDSGGSDSGSGIWGGIADAIAGLLSAIGTLIGGILKGFIDLLSNLLGTVTSALPLISDVAVLISGLYSFLPEDWQTILTVAFSLLLTFSVVKLVLGVMGK